MEKLKVIFTSGGVLTKEKIETIISYFKEIELEAEIDFSTDKLCVIGRSSLSI